MKIAVLVIMSLIITGCIRTTGKPFYFEALEDHNIYNLFDELDPANIYIILNEQAEPPQAVAAISNFAGDYAITHFADDIDDELSSPDLGNRIYFSSYSHGTNTYTNTVVPSIMDDWYEYTSLTEATIIKIIDNDPVINLVVASDTHDALCGALNAIREDTDPLTADIVELHNGFQQDCVVIQCPACPCDDPNTPTDECGGFNVGACTINPCAACNHDGNLDPGEDCDNGPNCQTDCTCETDYSPDPRIRGPAGWSEGGCLPDQCIMVYHPSDNCENEEGFDVNCDKDFSSIDLSDFLSYFSLTYGQGSFDSKFDVNNDGVFDSIDLSDFLSKFSLCYGRV